MALEWMDHAKEHLGLLEKPGPGSNPKVVELFALSGFPGIHDDAVAWCAAFVGAMFALSNITGSGSLMARSYERWGVGIPEPVWGCVGVKKRAGPVGSGHVGLVVGANAGTIFLLGGNQNDSVSIAGFPRSAFTAFRWPKGHPIVVRSLPVTIAGATVSAKEA